jgi:hypothetical protein
LAIRLRHFVPAGNPKKAAAANTLATARRGALTTRLCAICRARRCHRPLRPRSRPARRHDHRT